MRITELTDPSLKQPFFKKVVVDGIELLARSSGHNDLKITAFIASDPGDTPIGMAKFWKQGKSLFSEKTSVSPEHQRKGIATLMYQFAKSLGFNIQPSKEKTTIGQQFWKGLADKGSLSKQTVGKKRF